MKNVLLVAVLFFSSAILTENKAIAEKPMCLPQGFSCESISDLCCNGQFCSYIGMICN